jgi:hypothetical protein
MDVIGHRTGAGVNRRRKRKKSVSAGDLQANHEGLKLNGAAVVCNYVETAPPDWFPPNFSL